MSTVQGAPAGRLRRAIVLIPGFRREEQFFRRDALVNNLETVEPFPLARAETIGVAGASGQRLMAQSVRGREPGPDLEVFEAYWADMAHDDGEVGPWQKLGRGLDLMSYWLLSWRAWRAFAVSRYITAGLLFGAAILVLWYVALLLLVADTLRKEPALTQNVASLPLLGSLLEAFYGAADAIAHWYWWVLIAFVLSVVPVDGLVQLARFVKNYFENRPDVTGVGLRDRVRRRVCATLEDVLAQPYDEVVIVAHSFGSVLAVDVLADWPHQKDFGRLRLVTLGSPIAVLCYRSKWLDAERRELLANPDLAHWLDFYARTDWLCTAVPGHRERYGAESRELAFEAPLRQRLSGQTHLLYYRHAAVLEALAAPLAKV